jgi:hypothetical protein
VPSSYLTLEPGTPVRDRFGLPVGPVERVLVAGDYFDGIIVRTTAGRRFVDAPEVRRIRPAVVELSIARHDVEHPGEPRVLGAHQARHGRDEVTDDDREAVIEALKLAFVADAIDADGLAAAVERAHRSDSLEQLEALVR